jgi:hypothetical protein
MSTPESSSSDKGLADATQRTLEGAQLARLAAQLRGLGNTRDLVRALGDDPDQYASRLAAQYKDLALKTRQPVPPRAAALAPRLTATLDRLASIFAWWEKILAPNATVKLVQTPGTANTGGTGIGAEIYQGDIALGGDVWNSGTQEQWWVNTWQYMVPLPATPANLTAPASLSYRFNVGASVNLYRQDVVTGSVNAYATVATTGDHANHPIDFNNYASSDFAIFATLPTSSVPPILSGTVKISGTIPLVPGRTPAIGIVVGLIVSAAQGEVMILPGEYSSITLAPPDATMPSDLGKIEYRRDPPFWVEAVAKMLE